MTYKKMIEGIAERESTEWVEGFLTDKEKLFVLGEKTTLRIEEGTCFFESEIKVYGNIINQSYTVGGTIGENGMVYKSIIKDWNDKLVWASTQELRDMERIKEFKIS